MSLTAWDRNAQSIAAMSGDGCFRFAALAQSASLPLPKLIGGLNAAADLSDPVEITHGVMLDGDVFCIIESGIQKTSWLPVPTYEGTAQAVVFRIYRLGSVVAYTVSAAPLTAYTAAGWDAAFTPSFEGEDVDAYAPHAELFVETGRPIAVRGVTAHISGESSIGAVRLGVMFERNTVLDPYGENTSGSIYAAVLLPVLAAEKLMSLPAIECNAGDDIHSVEVSLPAVSCYAPELSGNYALCPLPAVACYAGDSAFELLETNDCVMTMPAISMNGEDNAYRAVSLPALQCRIESGNDANCVLGELSCNAGDAINGMYAEMPAVSVRIVTQTHHEDGAVYGEVPVYLRLSGDSEVINPAALPTSPLWMVASMSGTPFVVHTLDTKPLGLVAGGNISATRQAVLPTQPMRLMVGGEIGLEATSVLPTQPLGLIAGGDISAIVTSVLPTQPLDLILGGRLGWRDVLAKVYCMNADTGATSEYTNFVFNSFAKIGGRYFGASEDGLFTLDADTDTGKPIAAAFGFGRLDFGSPQLKTMSYCYLGTAAGSMKMRVDSHVNGKPAGYEYKARLHGRSIREVRFDLGRGLKSTYVMPTFYNANGDDFEVDNVRFLVSNSDRRI